jgi:hypothetical protein
MRKAKARDQASRACAPSKGRAHKTPAPIQRRSPQAAGLGPVRSASKSPKQQALHTQPPARRTLRKQRRWIAFESRVRRWHRSRARVQGSCCPCLCRASPTRLLRPPANALAPSHTLRRPTRPGCRQSSGIIIRGLAVLCEGATSRHRSA